MKLDFDAFERMLRDRYRLVLVERPDWPGRPCYVCGEPTRTAFGMHEACAIAWGKERGEWE